MRTKYQYATVRGNAQQLNMLARSGWRIHTTLETNMDTDSGSDEDVEYLVLMELKTEL